MKRLRPILAAALLTLTAALLVPGPAVASAFASHQLAVVAHSMGGLIIRWAVTLAPGAVERARHVGLAVTLGTPYDGSWLAEVGAQLLGRKANADDDLRDLVHVLLATCKSFPDDGCGALRDILDFFNSAYAFVPGSPELTALRPWPAGVRVETLGTHTLLQDTEKSTFFASGSGTPRRPSGRRTALRPEQPAALIARRMSCSPGGNRPIGRGTAAAAGAH